MTRQKDVWSAKIKSVFSAEERGEEGQSLLEMTFGIIFLTILVVALFELTMLFVSYIALLNASREGAVYASTHPTMSQGSQEYVLYEQVVSAEAAATGLLTTTQFLVIDPPATPEGTNYLDPIIVTVHYQLINPTQGIIVPMLGRMGLLQSIWVTAFTEMPIR